MSATATPIRPPANTTPPVALDEQWRDVLAGRFGLDPDSFQAAAGDTRLAAGASASWRFFDALPTEAPMRTWGAPAVGLAGTYAAVIHNLIPQHGDGLRALLGSRCASWQAFRSDSNHLPLRLPRLASGAIDATGVLVEMFQAWAVGQLDADEVGVGVEQLRRPDVVASATAMHLAAEGVHRWATTEALVPTEQPLAISLATDDAVVHARFASVRRIDAVPVSPGLLAGGTGGGTSGARCRGSTPPRSTLAHDHDDPSVWRLRAPTWDDMFGSDGILRRVTTGLVVADGIDITVAGTAIDNGVDRGRLPFAADGCGEGWRRPRRPSTVTTWSSEPGSPRVLGVITAPIDAWLASQPVARPMPVPAGVRRS